MKVIICRDDTFGYYVKSINDCDRTTVEGFCVTYWGALRKANRVAAQWRANIKRDSLGRPIVCEIEV